MSDLLRGTVARGTRIIEDTAGDLAYAWRTLSRSPGFAAVTILTLEVSSDYFDVTRVRPALGRSFRREEFGSISSIVRWGTANPYLTFYRCKANQLCISYNT